MGSQGACWARGQGGPIDPASLRACQRMALRPAPALPPAPSSHDPHRDAGRSLRCPSKSCRLDSSTGSATDVRLHLGRIPGPGRNSCMRSFQPTEHGWGLAPALGCEGLLLGLRSAIILVPASSLRRLPMSRPASPL